MDAWLSMSRAAEAWQWLQVYWLQVFGVAALLAVVAMTVIAWRQS